MIKGSRNNSPRPWHEHTAAQQSERSGPSAKWREINELLDSFYNNCEVHVNPEKSNHTPNTHQQLAPVDINTHQQLAPANTNTHQQLAPANTNTHQQLAPVDTNTHQQLAPVDTNTHEQLAPVDTNNNASEGQNTWAVLPHLTQQRWLPPHTCHLPRHRKAYNTVYII